MADEYIKREAVEEMLENAQMISDGEYCGYCTEDVCIDKIPTADVAPKSEVAREIFAEIENTINNELQNNHKVLPQVEFSNEIWNRISGRINALQGIRDFIAELKKKYTEDQNDHH